MLEILLAALLAGAAVAVGASSDTWESLRQRWLNLNAQRRTLDAAGAQAVEDGRIDQAKRIKVELDAVIVQMREVEAKMKAQYGKTIDVV